MHWAGHGVSLAFEILTDDSNLVMSEMELHWFLVHWSGLFFFCFLIVTVETHQSVHPVQFFTEQAKIDTTPLTKRIRRQTHLPARTTPKLRLDPNRAT